MKYHDLALRGVAENDIVYAQRFELFFYHCSWAFGHVSNPKEALAANERVLQEFLFSIAELC